ncbi:hypothetical protein D7X98_02280 [bacterium 1XD8-76]|nr:hypothetical protein D7X98_02280 [bacterium 1XD8-76]
MTGYYTGKCRRIRFLKEKRPPVFGGLNLGVGQQYSLNITNDIGIVVQYGRMDINQPNLSYLATMGFAEG